MGPHSLIGKEVTLTIDEQTADAMAEVLDRLGMDLAHEPSVVNLGWPARRPGETDAAYNARLEAEEDAHLDLPGRVVGRGFVPLRTSRPDGGEVVQRAGESTGDFFNRIDRTPATSTPAPRPEAPTGKMSEARMLEILASHPLGDQAVARMRREKAETAPRPAPDPKEARMREILASHPLGAAALATLDRAKAG